MARAELQRLTSQLESSLSAGECSEAAYTQRAAEADARFKRKKLLESLSRSTATEERIVALKRTMKEFLRSHGTESHRELKRAFHVRATARGNQPLVSLGFEIRQNVAEMFRRKETRRLDASGSQRRWRTRTTRAN